MRLQSTGNSLSDQINILPNLSKHSKAFNYVTIPLIIHNTVNEIVLHQSEMKFKTIPCTMKSKWTVNIKEGCNRGHGLSAAIKLGTPEPGFFHFGPRLTWIL